MTEAQIKQRDRDLAWNAANELKSLSLGDPRLTQRAIDLCQHLGERPTAPINQACCTWAETKAAYRFFSNEEVDPEEILRAHRESTLERMRSYDRVIVVQDTTSLNFHTHLHMGGLGGIGHGAAHSALSQGLFLHHSLAFSPEGVPLGIVDQKPWARTKASRGRSLDLEGYEATETSKWYRGLQRLAQLKTEGTLPREVITVCDRECDALDWMTYCRVHELAFVIRAKKSRHVRDGSKRCLPEFALTLPVAGTFRLEVISRTPLESRPSRGPRKKKRASPHSRIAQLEVRFGTVDLGSYQKPDGSLSESLQIQGVFVQEVGAPDGVEALEWFLLTSMPVKSFSEAREVIGIYEIRWSIELYHRILKSGCTVEKCRLGSADRLGRYLALMGVIAWRLHWLTYKGRYEPDSSAQTLLSEVEWRVLYLHIHKKNPSTHTVLPNARTLTHWIARLGGFLDRKCDGDPGPLTLWRGWQRLQDKVEFMETLVEAQKLVGNR
jgi:hypothetical protein